jgi:hypothetical protein
LQRYRSQTNNNSNNTSLLFQSLPQSCAELFKQSFKAEASRSTRGGENHEKATRHACLSRLLARSTDVSCSLELDGLHSMS